jgi:hypothetical protein
MNAGDVQPGTGHTGRELLFNKNQIPIQRKENLTNYRFVFDNCPDKFDNCIVFALEFPAVPILAM